jgi:hypothetical protein
MMEKGLVELQQVILAHYIFLLALTSDIGPPVQFMQTSQARWNRLDVSPHPLPAL